MALVSECSLFWRKADNDEDIAKCALMTAKRTCGHLLFAVIPDICGQFPLAPDPLPHDKIFP
jgi:hypothetical protein